MTSLSAGHSVGDECALNINRILSTVLDVGDVLRVILDENRENLIAGRLRLVKRTFGSALLWQPVACGVVGDTSTSANNNTSDVGLDHWRSIDIDLCELASLRFSHDGQRCVVLQRDGSTSDALQFPSSTMAETFLLQLHSLTPIQRSHKNTSLYLTQSGSSSPAKSSGGAGYIHQTFHNASAMAEHSLSSAWKLVRHFPQNPGTVVLTGLSRVAEAVLDMKLEENRPAEDLAEMLRDSELQDQTATPARLESSQVEGFEVVTEIKLAKVPQQPRLPPLTLAQFNAEFLVKSADDCGGVRLLDERLLLERIFAGGIEDSLRPRLWRHLLNCDRVDCSEESRREQAEQRRANYERMVQQWSSMSEDQLSRFSGMRERLLIVDKDVARTDRSIAFFAGADNSNVLCLRRILMTYCMFNFDLGYVQGMSDLLSPILYVIGDEVDTFWCFVGFMERLSDNFELSQNGIQRQFEHLHSLLQVYDPVFCAYLDQHDVSRMAFTFRWLLVWFKRELSWSHVLQLWEVLWTRKPCDNFVLLVALAVLVQQRSIIMESQLTASAIVKYVNDLAMNINLQRTLIIAHQIWRQFEAGDRIPAHVCRILGLPVSSDTADSNDGDQNPTTSLLSRREDTVTVSSNRTSEEDENSPDEAEEAYQTALENHYL